MDSIEKTEKAERVVGRISLDVTESDIENIVVSSFEGGSNYWMGLDNTGEKWNSRPKCEPLSMWAVKILLEGGSVELYDIEDEDEDKRFTLTLEGLVKGIELNAIERPFAANKEQWDAGDADCILQYALFGKVVFG